MNSSGPRLLFINHVMPIKGYHLPMFWAINSIVMNNATYDRSRTPSAPAVSFLSIQT
ncbi:hypothetical protein F383_37234 [Gossypium arboreum]|uniref:Uncharacterized protein n=1 Tax=Gossypium arboreum TaxID=29729 RepID=A0A0B0MBK0_GOSAR|nr:hypothetical protein F383_37234 [Gossypium arboreum]